jgi:hypothetical protein
MDSKRIHISRSLITKPPILIPKIRVDTTVTKIRRLSRNLQSPLNLKRQSPSSHPTATLALNLSLSRSPTIRISTILSNRAPFLTINNTLVTLLMISTKATIKEIIGTIINQSRRSILPLINNTLRNQRKISKVRFQHK